MDNTSTHGFTETGGIFTTVNVPGASVTTVNGIYVTTLVGEFRNSNSVTEGFIATPATTPTPEPAYFAPLAIGGVALLARRRKSAEPR
jgi:hypothetical protein